MVFSSNSVSARPPFLIFDRLFFPFEISISVVNSQRPEYTSSPQLIAHILPLFCGGHSGFGVLFVLLLAVFHLLVFFSLELFPAIPILACLFVALVPGTIDWN